MFPHAHFGLAHFGQEHFHDSSGVSIPPVVVAPRRRGGRILREEEIPERDPQREREEADAAARAQDEAITAGMLARIRGDTDDSEDAGVLQSGPTITDAASAAARASAGSSSPIRPAPPPQITRDDAADEPDPEIERRRKIARQNAFIILNS